MYLFQVHISRALTPEQGQAALKKMMEHITQQTAKGETFHTVKLPDVNQFEDPFPPWLKELLEASKMVYDSFNLCYQRECATLAEADKLRTWFDKDCRAWIAEKKLADEEFINRIHVRAMDTNEELADLNAF